MVDTVLSELISGTHGRQRRVERNIEKIDLQRARRYGMKEKAKKERLKYTYGGFVFIYDPFSNREVTSFPSSDTALSTSGTKVTRPVILPKKEAYEDSLLVKISAGQRTKILNNRDSWTSHSVLVVDMSGSMRRDDVNGAKCRSDGVWMALARDYIQKPLESGSRCSSDLISVVVMKDKAHVVMEYQPIDWVLYNLFIDLREWSVLRPSGPGNYLPALDAAEGLLMNNQRGSCSLSLMFFSDGKPSDHGNFASRMGQIAAKFGRRLSVTCIGMADAEEDFSTLNDMVSEAQSFGANASFGKPSLDADSLSKIITTLANSLTTSKTEMTDMKTGEVRKVRMDIARERIGTPDDLNLTSEWTVYKSEERRHIERVWTWNYKRNQFAQVLDTRCATCYIETNVLNDEKTSRGILCSSCEACCYCITCYRSDVYQKHLRHKCYTMLANRRLGLIVQKSMPSWDVGVKEPIFGEGAERIVRKFRYLDKLDSFVGPVMVAKESRFIAKDTDYDQRMDYHKEFMRTQAIAAEMANLFNNDIDNLSTHFPSSHHDYILQATKTMPRINFLAPLVVEAHNPEEYNILIEPMLEGKYEKFNDNMGMVKGKSAKVNIDELSKSFGNMGLGVFGVIEECSDDEDSDDEIFDNKESCPENGSYNFSAIKDEFFPQAFSHFSYVKSKKRFMVVDLQGVHMSKPDGTCSYELTDPVIHKHRKNNKTKFSQWTFGRTDRGEKGMDAFFHTHQCNEVCKLLGLEETKL